MKLFINDLNIMGDHKRKKALSSIRKSLIFNNIKKNYPSGWIENLGVVPLFLLAALRVAPIFFLLFLRIIFVFLVFEAISKSYFYLLYKLRFKVLAVFRAKVKELLILSITISHLFGQISYAKRLEKIKYLQVGEQFSLPFNKKSQYSVGNKKVLKSKFLKTKGFLLVKGVKAGLSDLIIWNHKDSTRYQIYVHHRNPKQASDQLMDLLKAKQIKLKRVGNYIEIIEPINDLPLLEKIQFHCKKRPHIQCEATLGQNLENQLFSKIYHYFYEHQITDINCFSENIDIICHYHSHSKLLLSPQLNKLKEQYHIEFLKNPTQQYHNFNVSFHFLEKTHESGQERSLGTSMIQTQLASLLSSKPQQGAFENPINFQNDQNTLRTLATPQIMTTIDVENEMKMGNEQSFTNSTANSQQTIWKFAGFNLKFKIYSHHQQLFLQYSTGMSSVEGDQIQGHHKKSTLKIELERPMKMFSLNIGHQYHHKQQLPRFSKLPIIGRLFRGKRKTHKQSQIIGYFLISRK